MNSSPVKFISSPRCCGYKNVVLSLEQTKNNSDNLQLLVFCRFVFGTGFVISVACPLLSSVWQSTRRGRGCHA